MPKLRYEELVDEELRLLYSMFLSLKQCKMGSLVKGLECLSDVDLGELMDATTLIKGFVNNLRG